MAEKRDYTRNVESRLCVKKTSVIWPSNPWADINFESKI